MASRFAWSRCRKVVCVGRNYREHAKELSNPIPENVMIFLKPSTSLVSEGGSIEIPLSIGEVHHEVELGVVISKAGRSITEDAAMDFVGGYALAIDMTARDLQSSAKAKGQPWTVAKGYDTFCPVSSVIDPNDISDPHNLRLWLKVNGETRQDGNTSDMIFNIPHIIHSISKIMMLEPNDLILTGTPAGVGKVEPGDVISAGLESLLTIAFPVITRGY